MTELDANAMSAEELETYKLNRRFDRIGRLVGDAKMKRLKGARVMVIGLGGVGSWAAEALVRSGVGKRNCDSRNLIMGNAVFVTGAFGFACASVAVRYLLAPLEASDALGGEHCVEPRH